MASHPPGAGRSCRRRGVARTTLPLRTLLALVLLGACRDGQVPLIGYPAPWVGRAIGRLAQARIDEMGAPRYVEIPDSLLMQRVPPPRYAGDIAFAESMVALRGMVGMVGPQSSRSTLLVAPIYAEAGIPLVAATATSSRIRALTPRVFQLAPDEDAEGEFLVQFAVDRLGARRVTIFYLVADEYGFGLRQALRESLRKRGLDPVDEVGFLADADVRRRVDESLRRATPDAVIVAARIPETAKLARRMFERRPDVPVLVGDGAPMNRNLLARLGDATPRLYGATWWHASLPDSASRAFATRFEREAGRTPTASDAVIYDGIMLLAEAVREAGPRRSSVRDWLESLGNGRPPYRGVTGPISFRPDRPVNLVMTQLQDGVVTIVDHRTRDR